jgi:hypothetical protein
MSTFTSTARAYLNFTLGLRGFLRERLTIDDMTKHVQDQIAQREESFLNTIRTSIYDYPQSPYLPLLKRAKLTHADIEQLVANNGLEGTLEELYEAGVYVTFEELKGRIPIKRGDLEYQVRDADFDNPDLKPAIITRSGGSTGTPSRSKLNFDYMKHKGINYLLMYHLHDVLDYADATWSGWLPLATTVNVMLINSLIDNDIDYWFTPTQLASASPNWYYTLLNYLMVGMVRLQGRYYPLPTVVPIDDPLPIAKWIVERVKNGRGCRLGMTVSKAVRLCLVAKENGLDLAGSVMVVGGEPSTDVKIKIIEDSGAQHLEQYACTEAGMIAMPCLNPKTRDDMHIMDNHIALIQRPVEVLEQTVDAVCLTTLFPISPKMLLNAQTDDFAIVEKRDCGCPIYDMGLHQHIHAVRSYRKLTGEGVTLVGSDMETILEHIFPSQFGGSLLDYQLVEEEDKQGFTKLFLYVAPHIKVEDERQLIDTLLNAMKYSAPSVQLAKPEFKQAQTIAIRRQQPILTPRGKYFSIYTLAMSHKARSEKN